MARETISAMHELLGLIVTFPVIVPTALLAVAVIYWGFVLVGALEVHHGAEGLGADGVGHHGFVDANHDGIPDHLQGGAPPSGLSALLSALHFDQAPLTVVVSAVAVFTWVFSVVEAHVVGPERLAAGALGVLTGIAVLLFAIVLALWPASLVVRPLGRIFVTHPAPERSALVGQVCVVVSTRVDDKFGQARLEDGGAGLLVSVRVEPGKKLGKGQRALLVRWDEAQDEYLVEGLDAILESDAAGPT